MLKGKMGKFIKYIVWELIPLHFLWKKVNPNYKPDQKPVTIGIWLITIYFACYGYTSTRYENRLERVEFKVDTFTTQIAAGVPFNYRTLHNIGSMKLPTQPSFLSINSIYRSILFPYQNQTYAITENFKTADKFVEHNLVKWKHMLNSANLRGAILMGVDLKGANLKDANLREANLQKTNLREANLQNANLSGAKLVGADLRAANLEGAALSKANLRSTKLDKTNLKGTDLRSAILEGADLGGANFREANLWEARLGGGRSWGSRPFVNEELIRCAINNNENSL